VTLIRSLVARLALLLTSWLGIVWFVFHAPLPWAGLGGVRPVVIKPDVLKAMNVTMEGFLTRLAKGSLGARLDGTPIREVLWRQAGISLRLLFLALLTGLLFGVLLGLLLHLGAPWLRRGLRTLLILGLGIPESLLVGVGWAAIIWLLFTWNWKPLPALWIANISWKHYVLPVFSLALFPASTIAQVISQTLAELSATTWYQVARAKGLSPAQLIVRHTAKHLAYRTVAAIPNLLPLLFSALIAIEWLFVIPGIARVFAMVLESGMIDPPYVAAIVTVLMLVYAICQALCEGLTWMLNPRRDSHA
jgi:ABC-type dipeptide/oligopeptide/nickel transport system permease component